MRKIKIVVDPAVQAERSKNYIKFILHSNPDGVEYDALVDGILEKNPELKRPRVEAALTEMLGEGKLQEETK